MSFTISARKLTQNYVYLNFRDVNFCGALLLPSKVRPCQDTCTQTNLEDPKHDLIQQIPLRRNSVSKYLNLKLRPNYFLKHVISFSRKMLSELILTSFML